MMVNACVTGILPRFRYVLLSDALLDSLSPLESAAVFGHEIGHVAHRHFLYFAFFFMGSLGVLSLFGDLVSLIGPLLAYVSWLTSRDICDSQRGDRGERALDRVWGCISGLCSAICRGGLSDRPTSTGAKLFPATWPTALPIPIWTTSWLRSRQSRREPSLCPVGIRIFADALTNVAQLQRPRPQEPRPGGTDPSPTGLRSSKASNGIRNGKLDFQRQVRRLRLGLGVDLDARRWSISAVEPDLGALSLNLPSANWQVL